MMWHTFVELLQLGNGTLWIMESLHYSNIQYRHHETIRRIKISGIGYLRYGYRRGDTRVFG